VPKSQLLAAISVVLTTCAPTTPPKTPVQTASFTTGRILLVRPIHPPATDGPLRAVLYEEESGSTQGAPAEFIVRTDEGAILSIVQENGPGFLTGDRVVILRGDRARLAKPG
jgi:hypothetical protein